MKKEALFGVLIVLAFAGIFISFFGWMNYSGYAVREISDCLYANNRFQELQGNAQCSSYNKDGHIIQSCENKEESGDYEYAPNEFKKWTFTKDNQREDYAYNLKTKTCEKR